MDSSKRVLIVGAKGCGKTALIAQLTKKVATPKTTKLNENYQESQLSAKFKVTTESLPIILVFTKCRDDSATKEFERDSKFHLLSANAKSGLGVEELKLKMFQLAYPEIDQICSPQPQLIEIITHTFKSTMSTIKSMKFFHTDHLEEESAAAPTIPFQLVKLGKYKSP